MMLTGIRDAVILYNPAAGRGQHRRQVQLERAQQILKQAGILAELEATTGPGSATAQARNAVADGRQLVIVCGGDGTINEIVNGLAGSQVPMAVLPGGTANVLVKELSLPWDIPRAAERLARGTPRRMALGVALSSEIPGGRRYFISLAGAGPDGKLVNAVDLETKRRMGILAYWFEGFRQLFQYSFPSFRVITAEQEHTATLVVAGRTKHYGGPVRITTEASLFEDHFEVLAATSQSHWRYATNLVKLLAGYMRGTPGNYYWKTTSVRCEATGGEDIWAQVDGEPIGRLPVEFKIVPDALTLVVPGES
ncbi:MAG: diacylglycerol kinase family lipid kinase [Acidobacteria bacterium]|nr:diacylglycerol kinase family lipid kinase [Acidobacteriota bacterium]MBI3664526.1 diacylglycerol kinase family lipid kinase [Acidobacteriota bacterium]